ncbi:DUF1573 domain-containing protein [Fimbriiglobus ruber]|uniref:DUF1573 domain-containing protein n=1 Tax=Fimbriiglobus ruber TaxID=1908690 RepID=A0A225DXH9_9BACT|nr:DUF1573 domain-containing protein [Fimbriiglobus ruber]OWK44294.1 hypothetical protein FRUB_02226 [Fimbriiglobus ruber]
MYPILAALLLGATPAPPETATLVAVAATVDRGDVRTGPPLTHKFELVHRGTSGAVEITGVETGCGCLKSTVSRPVLRPGERSEITLAVSTLTQPPGPNAWRAVVHFRPVAQSGPPVVSPDEQIELKVTATLIREVFVTPPALAVSTAGAVTRTITVTDRRPIPLTVTSVSTTSPFLTASLHSPATDAGAQNQVVDLTVTDRFPTGETDETVVLNTTDPACRELRVPVRVTKRLVGAVVVVPEAPTVRFVRGQTEASTLAHVRIPGGGLVRVERVECANPAVSARWSQDAGPVATVRFVVTADKVAPQGGRADVRMILATPPGEVVTVPLVWTVP